MPAYYYTAQNMSGKTIHGEMDAEDHIDLVRRLQEEGLFLISQKTKDESGAETPERLPPELSPEFHVNSGTPRWFRLGVVIAVLAAYYSFFSSRGPELPTRAQQQKIAQIKPGMTRGEVERVFPEYFGKGMSSSLSRYIENGKIFIEIPYDAMGGEWNSQNRVTGPPTVYTRVTWVGNKMVLQP